MKRNQLFLLTLSLLVAFGFFSGGCWGQDIVWQKSVGGTAWDSGSNIEPTPDGGYISVNMTYSVNGDVTYNHGGSDIWVVKFDSLGNIEWQKSYGGSGLDAGTYISCTLDGGYILTGWVASNNGNVSGNHGNYDVWVAKLDSVGTVLWQKCLGGTGSDNGNCIRQTSDGGYILVGSTESNNGDVSGWHGGLPPNTWNDVWVVKLDSVGTIEWQKCLGGSDDDRGYNIEVVVGGGYILTGIAESTNGDVVGNHNTTSMDPDIWVVKLDNNGVIVWQKCLGGTYGEHYPNIKTTLDGGSIVIGETISNDGDVSGNLGGEDIWVVKLDSIGDISWQKCFGGTQQDRRGGIQNTSDGGYILLGFTASNDVDVSGNHGGDSDVWVARLSSMGDIYWQKCFGGSQADLGVYIQITTDGGYIINGWTSSNDGDVSGYHAGYDAWVVRLTDNGVGFTSGINGNRVSFTNTSTNNGPFIWHFGDNTTSTVHSPTHVYCVLGTQNVCLESIGGESSILCKTINILPPVASYGKVVNGNTVNFTNTSQNALHYSWDFGDGTSDTVTFSPTHTYSSVGTKYVCLVASDSCLSDYDYVCQDVVITSTASISNATLPAIRLYPNPTEDKLYIEASNEKDIMGDIILCNTLGQVVLEKKVFFVDGQLKELIDLEGVSEGGYSFIFKSEGVYYIEKVMKY